MRPPASSSRPSRRIRWRFIALVLVLPVALAIAARVNLYWKSPRMARWNEPRLLNPFPGDVDTEAVTASSGAYSWWDRIPPRVEKTSLTTGPDSNIHPGDYVGPQACRNCHRKNYDSWSEHSHRRMNALAEASTVIGDFSGNTDIRYFGGVGSFYEDDGGYHMRLVRGDVERVYRVTQTIGSRFYQFYVGKLQRGPEEADHRAYREDHVLPFGYWLEAEQWVPHLHVHEHDQPDGERTDPFDATDGTRIVTVYSRRCSSCHTVFPMGDELCNNTGLVGLNAPRNLHFDAAEYLAAHRRDVWSGERHPTDIDYGALIDIYETTAHFAAPEKAVTLGISCEACHLGCKQHVQDPDQPPHFFPHSPHLLLEKDGGELELGRTHENLNWICGRCHVGTRPEYAGGMSTWNSTEYSDARRGSCYTELTCVTCHNPHETIGRQWSHSSIEDDATCQQCHQQYESAAQREAHTHHAADSAGSACMNCHMPRINEGLQDMVRTHTIFSPTHRDMIRANHPNACNMCHTDQPIDWTLDRLTQWYGASYDEQRIAEAYPQRDLPAALGWLASEEGAVRLVAADALARRDGRAATSHLIQALDDPMLVNRQFAQRWLERLLDVKLNQFGYQFYLPPDRRGEPIQRLQESLTELAPRNSK